MSGVTGSGQALFGPCVLGGVTSSPMKPPSPFLGNRLFGRPLPLDGRSNKELKGRGGRHQEFSQKLNAKPSLKVMKILNALLRPL